MGFSAITLVVTLALGLLAAPLPVKAQQAGNLPRVGYLAMGRHPSFPVFTQGLRDLGYVDGRNIVLESRFAEVGKPEQFDALAGDLVRRGVDVIVALINPEIAAAKRATSTIPIVMVVGVDPVGRGFVHSLARPGGNVTGLTWDPDPEIAGKMVEVLSELLPALEQIGGLVDPSFPVTSNWNAAQRAAEGRELVLKRFEVRGPGDLETAFVSMRRDRIGAVFVFGGSILFGSRAQIAQLGVRTGLPVMFPYREAVELGGLVSYGPSLPDLWRRSATYVDRILRGTNPADLPVEQPTKFDLVINLKTAKALGLTIPDSVLFQADKVIK